MSWIDNSIPEVLRTWLKEMHCPVAATEGNGKFLWCNVACEEMIGYSVEELIVDDAPCWNTLTVDKRDHVADALMSQKCETGEIKEYTMIKEVRRKDGICVPVNAHILRYPSEGEFKCFLVAAIKIGNWNQDVMSCLSDMHSDVIRLVEIVATMSKNDFASRMSDFANKNPKMFYTIMLFLSFILFGDRVIEFGRHLTNGFDGSKPQVIYIEKSKD